MTDKLQVATELKNHNVAAPVDQAELLKNIAARVSRDSVERSDEYLDETTVPHGGE